MDKPEWDWLDGLERGLRIFSAAVAVVVIVAVALVLSHG